MKLTKLVDLRFAIRKLYTPITDYDRVMKIVPVIDEIEKHLKAYDKALNAIQELAKTEPQQAEKKYQDLLEKEIKVDIFKVTKQEVKNAGLNAFEYRQLQDWIE